MRSSHSLDRVDTAFDDDRLVADAGLLLPATLASHLGLKELVERHLDLGDKPGRANAGDKLLTLVMSALAGGDCIDDVVALGAGGTGRILGFTLKAASTLGTFLRSFSWGHVRQLDRVSRELLARAWAAGAGPGAEPFTIDLDSTICETYGLKKAGARHHTYTHVRVTDRDSETLTLEADHRRHAEIENAIRIGLAEGIVTTKTLRRRLFSLPGRLTRSARRLTLHLPARWPWAIGWAAAIARIRAIPLLA